MGATLDPGVLVLTKRFLESLRLGPPGGRWSFMVPGAPIGLELYIDFDRLRTAALIAFRQFDTALAGQNVDDVSKRLQKCLLDNMERTKIAERIFDAVFQGAYQQARPLADVVDSVAFLHFARLLQEDLSRTPDASLYLRPVWRWRAPDPPIVSEPLVWVPGTYDLNSLAEFIGIDDAGFVSSVCPPIARWNGRKVPLGQMDSWIGACASNDVAGASALRRIRGALALALPASRSRTFSMATVERWEIRLHPNGSMTITTPEELVPPLSSNPQMTDEQFAFVKASLVGQVGNQRLQVALEYAAAGWEPRGRLGFLHNAIAFDALYGDSKIGVGKSIKAGIAKGAASFRNIEDRANMLYRIRNSLTHGEVASIEACPEYLKYIERFRVDPASDQVRILQSCVHAFSGMPVSSEPVSP